MYYGIVACIVLALLAAYCSLYLRRLGKETRTFAASVTADDYIPPVPSKRILETHGQFFDALIKWLVGDVEVIGKENLPEDGQSTPLMIVCNHCHFMDPVVVGRIIDRQAYWLTAVGILKFAGGLGASFLSKFGAIPVEILPNCGGPARESAVKVLSQGTTLVVFPEAWAYLDGEIGPFKTGCVRIAKKSSLRANKSVDILPVFVGYGKYPGKWLRKIGPPWEYLFLALTSWYYRRGAKVVFGEPVSTTSLPSNNIEATEFLRQRIISLGCLASRSPQPSQNL